LAAKLNLLASHLILWQAKFETLIPDNPKHALIDMADELDHGLAFPVRVDNLVTDALREMRSPFNALPFVACVDKLDPTTVSKFSLQSGRRPTIRTTKR
jgi:hypothetical protein